MFFEEYALLLKADIYAEYSKANLFQKTTNHFNFLNPYCQSIFNFFQSVLISIHIVEVVNHLLLLTN